MWTQPIGPHHIFPSHINRTLLLSLETARYAVFAQKIWNNRQRSNPITFSKSMILNDIYQTGQGHESVLRPWPRGRVSLKSIYTVTYYIIGA